MKYLTFDEMKEMCNAAVHPSHRLLLWLLSSTGLRISEALQLTVKNINFKEACLYAPSLKHKKATTKVIPLSEGMLSDLKNYCSNKKDNSKLFGYSRVWAWMLIQKYAKKANIDSERAHPHSFRHGFAIHCLKNDIPLPIIQKWLGHSSIMNTQIYLDIIPKDTQPYYAKLGL